LLSMTDSPLSRDRVKLSDPRQVDDGSPYFDIVRTRMPSGAEAAEAEARVLVQIRATECLLALKLWMDRTHQVPTDLDTVVRAAGLPKVPIDPYSGRPLLMAIIDGEPVVYSIGLDGHDDGGRIDSRIVSQPGDQTFRLPSMEKPKR
jgi:hypothetical protein